MQVSEFFEKWFWIFQKLVQTPLATEKVFFAIECCGLSSSIRDAKPYQRAATGRADFCIHVNVFHF